MQLGLGQHLKMGQQMRLAPRMIQSMEILQLPLLELKERVDQELIENPLLDEPPNRLDSNTRELGDYSDGGESAEPLLPAERPLEQKELSVDNDHNNQDDFERLSEMGDSWQDDDSFSPRTSANRTEEEGERVMDQMAAIVAKPPSLQEHLLEQISFFDTPPVIRAFAEYLIQNLDSNGRLSGDLPELLQAYLDETPQSLVTPETAREALELIQKLDPPGVGARSLAECFLLQLKPDAYYRKELVVLITSHLEDLAENRLSTIERQTGFDLETIAAARDELLTLNPRPGRDFGVTLNHDVTPDLFVERDDHGKWAVRVENEYTPRLNISRRYQQILADRNSDPQTREYIKKKIESAKWLIEAVQQRYSTLRRVAQAIVDRQIPFLLNGPEYIVPLKMQQIAEEVGVHVTTVSRAVDDKYVQTPRGVFSLRRFFSAGTKTTDGDDVAWDIIRMKLKEIVDAEDKKDPLSDEALMEALEKQGYQLARRTITKYRKALNIPSSRNRRAI